MTGPGRMNADGDESLMEALAAGDDRGLNRLMDRWQAPLRGFLYRYTQNDQDAMDLAQETFVRIHQHRRSYRPGARFSTWMFQIALNLARSRARWQRRHPGDAPDHATELPDTKAAATTEADPADRALQAERASLVRGAIAELPADLREAVLLFEYEGKTHAEIAEIARTTAKAVETRLYRARQRLRRALARYLV